MSGKRIKGWCVAILLAFVVTGILHVAAAHHPLHRDCLTCQTLQALSFALVACWSSLLLPSSSPLNEELTDPIRPASFRSLRPLRAPPPSTAD